MDKEYVYKTKQHLRFIQQSSHGLRLGQDKDLLILREISTVSISIYQDLEPWIWGYGR